MPHDDVERRIASVAVRPPQVGLFGQEGQKLQVAGIVVEVELALNAVARIRHGGIDSVRRRQQFIGRTPERRRRVDIGGNSIGRRRRIAVERAVDPARAHAVRTRKVGAPGPFVPIDVVTQGHVVVSTHAHDPNFAVEAIARCEAQLAADVFGTGSADVEPFGGHPLVRSVVLVHVHVQRVTECVVDGTAQFELNEIASQIGSTHPQIAFKHVTGVAGDIVDGAGKRRAAECRALRSAEHFNPLYPRELHRALGAHQRQAIDERHDLLACRCSGLGLNTPHGRRGVVSVAIGVEVDTWGHLERSPAAR